jgi:Glycosyl transferase family 2
MKLVGMMPVRNEEWVLGLSLRVALMWCDEVVVLLHACTDRSAEIVSEIQQEHKEQRVTVLVIGGEWLEMEHRQQMLRVARTRGATHLAIIDADEVLTGNLIPARTGPMRQDVRDMVSDLGGHRPDAILELPGYNLRNGVDQFHNNGVWGNRWFSTAFADNPALSWTGDTFHHREPHGKKLNPYRPIQQGQGGVMHMWGASERRLRAKHALYKITERLRWPAKDIRAIDNEYSLAIHGQRSFGAPTADSDTPNNWTYSPVPESWWAPYAHLMKYLDVDAEPWQIAECQRMVAEHGREKFAGLDLFGVA